MITLLDILAQRLDAELRRDRRYHATCPFCDKPAKAGQKHFSFCDRGYSCWVCEAQGSLVALALHLDVPGDYQAAPRRVQEPARPKRWQSAPERFLSGFCAALDRVWRWQQYKPLTLDSIARWRLGVGVLPSSRCEKRRLIVPVFADGQIVAFHGRAFLPGDTDAKWLTSGGSSKQVLFNADLLRPSADVIICENYVDTILAMQEEPSAVAVCGGGASWQSAWTAQIAASRPRQVLIWLDHDLAGNGSRYHYQELVAEWKRRNPKAQRVPEPAGPEIANELLSAGVRGRVFEWPKGTPPKADLGWYLMNERRAA
jgi:hypothetical protein